MDTLKVRRGSGKAATRRTSPNDANRVVWAIGTCFLLLFVFLLLLNNIYRNYGYNKATEGLREGGDEENGPKRRESHRLGHWYVFFFFLSCFFFNSFLSTRTLGATVLRMDTKEATTRRTGPHDAKRVVWAISKCFFLFFVLFFYSKSFI